MATTNAELRRTIFAQHSGMIGAAAPAIVPDRFSQRFEPDSRRPARGQDGFADRPDAREVRTIEIVLVPDRRTGGGWLRGLGTVAKILAVPAVIAGALLAEPVYDCRKQKSYGMLYYGTTVQMCVSERLSGRFVGVQAAVDRTMRAM